MADTLTPETVAAIRECRSIRRDAQEDEDIIQLCDMVDDLREQLREADDGETHAHEMTVLVEGELDALQAVIRRLTDALQGLLESGIGFDDERIKYITVQVYREDWQAAERALAEIEGKPNATTLVAMKEAEESDD